MIPITIRKLTLSLSLSLSPSSLIGLKKDWEGRQARRVRMLETTVEAAVTPPEWEHCDTAHGHDDGRTGEGGGCHDAVGFRQSFGAVGRKMVPTQGRRQ